MAQERLASHILPNSVTMIGVCVTAIGLVKLVEAHIGPSHVDEYAALTALIFLVSATFSYTALRFDTGHRIAMRLERLADIAFLVGLVALILIALLFAYEAI